MTASPPLNTGAIPVSRVTRVDLDELLPLLMQRLADRFPGATEGAIKGLILGAIDSNESLFIRTPHTVGMVQIRREPLEPPYLKEIFVIAEEGFDDEGAVLYEHFARWATGMQAAGIIVNEFTDVSQKPIEAVIGKVIIRKMYVVAPPFAPSLKAAA